LLREKNLAELEIITNKMNDAVKNAGDMEVLMNIIIYFICQYYLFSNTYFPTFLDNGLYVFKSSNAIEIW
jgi:hypothetical protein